MKSQPLYYPGEEPIEVADQIKSLIDALSNEYPDHMLPAKLSPAHDQNAQMMAFMLGYESKNDFFEAYGFGCAASKKSSRNYDTILTDVRSKVQDKTEKATEGTATRVHNLLTKLDEAYPDSNITGFRVQHKKWGEAAAELSKLLGYESSDAFLQAYGYVLEKNAGGRPSKDPTVVLDELRKRYPNGAPVKTVTELSRENPDLAGRLKTLGNSAQKLFGKSLINHLIEIGIVQTETAVLVDRSRTPKDDQTELSERGAAVLAELKLQYAASPARTHLSAFKKAHPSVNWPALMAYMQRCTPFTGLEALLVHEGVLVKPMSSQEAMEYIVSTLKERLGGKPFEGTYVQLQEAYPDLPYDKVLNRTPTHYLQQCGVLKRVLKEKSSDTTAAGTTKRAARAERNALPKRNNLTEIVVPGGITKSPKRWKAWLEEYVRCPGAVIKAAAELLNSGKYSGSAYKILLANFMLNQLESMTTAEKKQLHSDLKILMPDMAQLLERVLKDLDAIERYSFELGWCRKPTQLKKMRAQNVGNAFCNPAIFRGPVSRIRKLMEKYKTRDFCELGKGVAHIIVDNNLNEGPKLSNIIREFPELRCAFFTLLYGYCVCYSESGYGEVTDVESVDPGKCEEEHWTWAANVLEKGNYSSFDTRTELTVETCYEFPYEKEWISDQYILEDGGAYYQCGPAKTEQERENLLYMLFRADMLEHTGMLLGSLQES